jgi:hypothetical protein
MTRIGHGTSHGSQVFYRPIIFPPDSREGTPCRGPVRRLAGVGALMIGRVEHRSHTVAL